MIEFIIIVLDIDLMHVTYGFVYYFCVIMLAMTASLSVFVFRPLRKKVCSFFKRVKLMDHFLVQSIVYISFVVIFVILIDAVWTYYSLKKNLDTGNLFTNSGASNMRDFALDNFELVKADNREDYLQLYRNYREFYMSERNFMLTSSALFIAFVFHRLCATISKLNDLESEIEDGKMQPCSE